MGLGRGSTWGWQGLLWAAGEPQVELWSSTHRRCHSYQCLWWLERGTRREAYGLEEELTANPPLPPVWLLVSPIYPPVEFINSPRPYFIGTSTESSLFLCYPPILSASHSLAYLPIHPSSKPDSHSLLPSSIHPVSSHLPVHSESVLFA